MLIMEFTMKEEFMINIICLVRKPIYYIMSPKFGNILICQVLLP